MSQYEERLEKDLAYIREALAALVRAVETALEDAARALFTSDDKLAYSVVLGDLAINRASRALDKTCHGFFAVHLPSAGHLRFVSSVMRVNLELERIGDYAVTICRESVQIGHPPKGPVGQQMEAMVNQVRDLLSQAVGSFNSGDSDQARDGMEKATQVVRSFDAVFNNLMDQEGKIRIQELFYELIIFNMLRRVADQSKNICEETIFAVTGQTKPAKSYRILFLDQDNTILGPMAVAIASKNFPQSGEYDSAGRQAGAALDGKLDRFLHERGIELGDISPKTLDPAADLADYHVIVSLQGPIRSYMDPMPFHPVALEWEIDEPPVDSLQTTVEFETLYRTLASQVRDLMTALHGEEAP